MLPCANASCSEWTSVGRYCAKCTTDATEYAKLLAKPTRAYDALEVTGIGVVSPRRILVNRPKPVRRSFPVSRFTDWSYSMQRDLDELENRGSRSIRNPTPNKPRAAKVDHATEYNKRLKLGAVGNGEQD